MYKFLLIIKAFVQTDQTKITSVNSKPTTTIMPTMFTSKITTTTTIKTSTPTLETITKPGGKNQI